MTQLRTDGVLCRESAGTGSEVLKVVPVTGAVFSGFIVDQSIFMRPLFPHPPLIILVLLIVQYVVNMCDTESVGGVSNYCYYIYAIDGNNSYTV